MAQINGTDGDDSLAGTAAEDVMVGGAGDDTIRSSAGDDAIEGGAGLDTYVLNIGRSGFGMTSPAEGVFVIQPTPGGLGGSFGTDTVTGIESFGIVSSTGTMTLSADEMLARFSDGPESKDTMVRQIKHTVEAYLESGPGTREERQLAVLWKLRELDATFKSARSKRN